MLDYSDQSLLHLIATGESIEIRNQAFTVFYDRYQPFVASSLWRVCGPIANNDEFCLALLNNTFLRVYRHRKPFVIDDHKTAEEKQRHVEGWLLKIAQREFWKQQSNDKYPPDEAVEAYEMMIQASTLDEHVAPFEEDVIREAYALLSPRDQHIVHTYWQYYSPGKGIQAKNLPETVLTELATRYAITPENIRQVISRGNKKIKEYVENNYVQSNRTTRASHVGQQ